MNNYYRSFLKSLETVPEEAEKLKKQANKVMVHMWHLQCWLHWLHGNAIKQAHWPLIQPYHCALLLPEYGSPCLLPQVLRDIGRAFIHPPTAWWDQDGMKMATYLLLYFPATLASVEKLPLPLPSLPPPGNHTQKWELVSTLRKETTFCIVLCPLPKSRKVL